jgi:hypothetical protein
MFQFHPMDFLPFWLLSMKHVFFKARLHYIISLLHWFFSCHLKFHNWSNNMTSIHKLKFLDWNPHSAKSPLPNHYTADGQS